MTEQMPDAGSDAGPDAGGAEARIAVLQAVVDRVTSWQDGATPETVRQELDAAIAQTDVEIDEATREDVVRHIVEDGEHVDVRLLLT